MKMVSGRNDKYCGLARRRYWSDIAIGGLLAAERNGNNYALLGNVVLNVRGRGLALGAAGLARGNIIVHPKYWGIQVRPLHSPRTFLFLVAFSCLILKRICISLLICFLLLLGIQVSSQCMIWLRHVSIPRLTCWLLYVVCARQFVATP